MQYDFAMVIGRFQPIHREHVARLFRPARALSDNLRVILGSPGVYNEKNPFTIDERREMILSSIENLGFKNVTITSVPDTETNEEWTGRVVGIYDSFIDQTVEYINYKTTGKAGIGVLVGADKDAPYLSWFQPYMPIHIEPSENTISATHVREALVEKKWAVINDLCPENREWLFNWRHSSAGKDWVGYWYKIRHLNMREEIFDNIAKLPGWEPKTETRTWRSYVYNRELDLGVWTRRIYSEPLAKDSITETVFDLVDMSYSYYKTIMTFSDYREFESWWNSINQNQ